MKNCDIITPKKLQGFWELMPKEQILFSSLLNKLETVFADNCFVPLDTPVLEYSETLLAKSGGETDKEVYRFTKGSNDVCMRYDLTVPLARFVAMHKNELNFPFKRYQIGKVYRGERPQKGRFREFYQCDADIIGNGELSITADAECLSLFEKCYKALDLDVTIEVSNRKILSGYIESINKTEQTTPILVLLDKIGKIPMEEITHSLKEIGLNENECKDLISIIQTSGNISSVSEKLRSISKNELYLAGVEELCTLSNLLNAFGVKNVVFDLAIIRGHNYYTGTVFEAVLTGKKELGSIGGGGRFENLCSYFSEDKMPGVGMSVGITRLFDILRQENYFNLDKNNEIDCAVLNFDSTLSESLSLVQKLRENGVRAEIFYENKSFKSKMKEANRRQVKFVVVVGEDEIKANRFTLKNMETGEQSQKTLSEIVEIVKSGRM
jgi:histidyl-tRNA synthetase